MAIDQWALEKADKLIQAEDWGNKPRDAFARYIAAHEEAPVDRLLLEARVICASMPGLSVGQQWAYRDGEFDVGGSVDLALTALRRGIEIAGETP